MTSAAASLPQRTGQRMGKFSRLVVLLIALPWLAGCNGPTTPDGVQRYADGDYAAARDILQLRSTRNDPVASYFLAQMYERGDGVKADLDRALNLYMSAASRGLPQGQAALAALQSTAADGNQLALRLQTLHQVADQHPEAGLPRLCEALLYLAIKDQETDYATDFLACSEKLLGYDAASAQRLLASANVSGALGKKDFDKGARFAEQAAEAGDAGAHAILAAAYAEGLGKPRDYGRAYAYAMAALVLGSNNMSAARKTELDRLQQRAFRNLSPTQQQAASKLAEQLKTAAAAQKRSWELEHRFGWALHSGG